MTILLEPLVVQVMRGFKAALLAREQVQIQRMADRWLVVERTLRGQMELAARDLEAEKRTGKAVSQWKLARMERYQDLLRQLEQQMAEYNRYAEAEIMTQQNSYGQLGIDHGVQAINASYAEAAVRGSFNVLPVDAIQEMVGLLGDGSPLATLLTDAYGTAAEQMSAALLQGTALGWNPRKTAAAMSDGIASGLGRILTTARTEQLRVYLEANRQQYEHSGVVEGFVRLVAHDNRTCMACLAAEGEWFPVAEALYDHPNGRCSSVPKVDGVRFPAFTRGVDWFRAQPEPLQYDMIAGQVGKEAAQRWLDGDIDFERFYTKRPNRVWGASLNPTTQRELLKGGGQSADIYEGWRQAA